ncbi:hypothetical protein DIPPA_14347 [Diplonema papillatum]|nr:hypothetical protein DIPPA_14347 [Diplonema papillatum]
MLDDDLSLSQSNSRNAPSKQVPEEANTRPLKPEPPRGGAPSNTTRLQQLEAVRAQDDELTEDYTDEFSSVNTSPAGTHGRLTAASPNTEGLPPPNVPFIAGYSEDSSPDRKRDADGCHRGGSVKSAPFEGPSDLCSDDFSSVGASPTAQRRALPAPADHRHRLESSRPQGWSSPQPCGSSESELGVADTWDDVDATEQALGPRRHSAAAPPTAPAVPQARPASAGAGAFSSVGASPATQQRPAPAPAESSGSPDWWDAVDTTAQALDPESGRRLSAAGAFSSVGASPTTQQRPLPAPGEASRLPERFSPQSCGNSEYGLAVDSGLSSPGTWDGVDTTTLGPESGRRLSDAAPPPAAPLPHSRARGRFPVDSLPPPAGGPGGGRLFYLGAPPSDVTEALRGPTPAPCNPPPLPHTSPDPPASPRPEPTQTREPDQLLVSPAPSPPCAAGMLKGLGQGRAQAQQQDIDLSRIRGPAAIFPPGPPAAPGLFSPAGEPVRVLRGNPRAPAGSTACPPHAEPSTGPPHPPSAFHPPQSKEQHQQHPSRRTASAEARLRERGWVAAGPRPAAFPPTQHQQHPPRRTASAEGALRGRGSVEKPPGGGAAAERERRRLKTIRNTLITAMNQKAAECAALKVKLREDQRCVRERAEALDRARRRWLEADAIRVARREEEEQAKHQRTAAAADGGKKAAESYGRRQAAVAQARARRSHALYQLVGAAIGFRSEAREPAVPEAADGAGELRLQRAARRRLEKRAERQQLAARTTERVAEALSRKESREAARVRRLREKLVSEDVRSRDWQSTRLACTQQLDSAAAWAEERRVAVVRKARRIADGRKQRQTALNECSARAADDAKRHAERILQSRLEAAAREQDDKRIRAERTRQAQDLLRVSQKTARSRDCAASLRPLPSAGVSSHCVAQAVSSSADPRKQLAALQQLYRDLLPHFQSSSSTALDPHPPPAEDRPYHGIELTTRLGGGVGRGTAGRRRAEGAPHRGRKEAALNECSARAADDAKRHAERILQSRLEAAAREQDDKRIRAERTRQAQDLLRVSQKAARSRDCAASLRPLPSAGVSSHCVAQAVSSSADPRKQLAALQQLYRDLLPHFQSSSPQLSTLTRPPQRTGRTTE